MNTPTNQKILAAAEKCPAAKATFEALFPDVFTDNAYVMKKIKHNPASLVKACEDLGLGAWDIQVIEGAADDTDDVGKGLYLTGNYNWELKKMSIGCFALIPKNKP